MNEVLSKAFSGTHLTLNPNASLGHEAATTATQFGSFPGKATVSSWSSKCNPGAVQGVGFRVYKP